MNKEEFDKKYDTLLGQVHDLLKKTGEELWNSGRLNVESYDGKSMYLPKIILYHAMGEARTHFLPVLLASSKDLKSMEIQLKE